MINPMQRQDQYQEYVRKLKKAQLNDSSDQLLKQMSDKTDYMLQYLKTQMPSQGFNTLQRYFVGAIALVSLISFIKFGGVIRFIPFGLSILYVIFYRHQSIQLSKSDSFDRLKDDESINSLRYVEGKVNHVRKAIEMKSHKILQVKYLYVLFFPFVLFFIGELIFGRTPFNHFWIALAVAFIIGSFIWKYHFDDDLEELDQFESSLIGDLNIYRQRV